MTSSSSRTGDVSGYVLSISVTVRGERGHRSRTSIWPQQFDVLNVKVTVNDNRKSYSRRIEAEPDDEFVIGHVLTLPDMECYIHAIKARDRLHSKGSVEAREVVRIYGKMKRRVVPIIEFEDEDEEDIEF